MGIQYQFTHSIRHEEARIAAHADQLTDLGGRDFQLRDRMDVDAAGARFVQIADSTGAPIAQKLSQRPHPGRTPARTMSNHQMGQLQQLAPLMPFRQAQEGVHTDDQAEAAVRILVTQLRQGLDRVGRAGLAHLTIVDDETGLAVGCRLHHLQAQLRIGERLIAVRRIAGREKPNFLQSQRLLQFECGAQMRVVNGIEGSTENAHRVHGATLPDSGVACKAPARAPVSPVTALHASPIASPLMTLSVWLACKSRRANGSFLSLDSAFAEGAAARFQPLPRGAERSRSRSRACHSPRTPRTSTHKINVGSSPALFGPSSTRKARAPSPAAAASASWNTS